VALYSKSSTPSSILFISPSRERSLTTQRERERERERDMAEEFRPGTCSGGSWWTAAELVEAKARSFDESAGSACGSSITFQETHKIQHPDGGLSASSMTWTQALLYFSVLRRLPSMSCNHRSPKLSAVVHSQQRYISSSSCFFVLVIRVLEPQWIMPSFSKQMESSRGDRDSCSSSTKKTGSEAATKKPRIETHSPLPTFKVRKEKLGDRITALQQLVSPFGKTDTASVLQEAIEYIKFLHDQVGVLSSPYLKNGQPMKPKQISEESKDCDEPKQDLRSRGLCLVPVTSTYPVASETTTDFWHPTLGGTFR
ncbi:unnamed protein product, partial [Musa textilis]